MTSICFVLCYLGPLPRYFDTFLATCERNADVDFLIASDQPEPPDLGSNIRWMPTTLPDLRARFARILGFPAALDSGYKLCDYKPLLGAAFTDELEGYAFWGFTDPDLVWGHIRSFATEERLVRYDVLTFRGRDFISGPCTLLRNEPRINGLYAEAPGYERVFRTPRTCAFTELCGRWKERPPIADLVRDDRLVSFSDVVRAAADRGELRWLDEDEIVEWDPRGNPFRFVWADGHLVDLRAGREVLMYHYVLSKKRPFFYIPAHRSLPEAFYITYRGAFDPVDAGALHRVQYQARRVSAGIPRALTNLRARLKSKVQRAYRSAASSLSRHEPQSPSLS